MEAPAGAYRDGPRRPRCGWRPLRSRAGWIVVRAGGQGPGPPGRGLVVPAFPIDAAGELPQIPDSVGRVEPPEWSRSLPGRFEFGAGDDFDEFAGRTASHEPDRESAVVPEPVVRRTLRSPAPTGARHGAGDAQGHPGPRQLSDRRDEGRHDGHRPACAPRADPLRGAPPAGGRRQGRIAGPARSRAGPPDGRRGGRRPRAARAPGRAGPRGRGVRRRHGPGPEHAGRCSST